jgi:hypothetical protein
VDYFNPLANVSVASNLDVESVGRDAHTLGEVIGLALRSAVSCPMELNLRPGSVVAAERVTQQRPFIIAAGVLVLAGLASWWQLNAREAAETAKVTEGLEAEAAPLKSVAGRIQAETTEIARLEGFKKPLVDIIQDRGYWAKALTDLNERLPKQFIWITSFEMPSPEDIKKYKETKVEVPAKGKKPAAAAAADAPKLKVMVKGIYLWRDAKNEAGPNSTVDAFLANLKDSPYFVPSEDSAEGFVKNIENSNQWGYTYAIPLFLKNPIEF